MTVSQKRAIWYSYRKKEIERMNEYIAKYNLMYEFKCSHYKTLRGFLNHIRNQMFFNGEDISEISEALR